MHIQQYIECDLNGIWDEFYKELGLAFLGQP